MILTTEMCGCEFKIGGWVGAVCKHGHKFTLGRGDNRYELLDVTGRPKIVCLCGSTRFSKAFQTANLEETLEGNIVLTVGCDTHSDDDLFSQMNEADLAVLKRKLDELHLRKIDLSDEVLILNVDGYIGESTAGELAYAKKIGRVIRYLE